MSSEAKSRATVLVVDDEPEIREIVAMSATQAGYDVLEAGDGHQALEVVRTHSVDIIVSDLMMPRVSGLSLLGDLREEGHLQPLIILTAYPSQDSTLQALRLGAFDYLEKPFDAKELLVLMEEAMRVSKSLGAGLRKPETRTEPNVPQELAKLRTLRFAEPSKPAQARDVEREKMAALFVAEATPQLLFCESAIKALVNQEERAFELGYLFRVMQAVGATATALGASGCAALARAAELYYTALRVRPRAVTQELAELALRANAALQTAVGRLDDEAHAGLIEELQAATREVEYGVRAS